MPTTQPTAGDVHVSRPLTNFAQKYLQSRGFVALEAMPNIPVAKDADQYYVFDRDDFFRDDAEERADGAESSGGSFTLSTDPYFAKVYAHHKDVTDRQRSNQDQGIDLDRSATQYVTHKLMIRREALFMDAFMGTGKWATDLSPSTKWESASAVPLEEFATAMRTVQLATGFRPNKAIFGRQAYDTLKNNDDVIARVSGGATTAMPALVMQQKLAELLELDRIFVADAIKTTSVKGASSATRAFIANQDDVLVYYAPDSAGLEEPTAGVSFSWTGPGGNTPAGMRIKRFRWEATEADRVEGQMAFDYKLTGADLGYYFNNVTT